MLGAMGFRAAGVMVALEAVDMVALEAVVMLALVAVDMVELVATDTVALLVAVDQQYRFVSISLLFVSISIPTISFLC
jgi:hypothetical protein